MSHPILEIPDDFTSLRPWLEEQIQGCQLGQLVSEMAGVAGAPSTPASLESLLGARLPDVLQGGLAALDDHQLSQLLQQPLLLLDLQEQILLSENSYWSPRLQPADVEALERGWKLLASSTGFPTPNQTIPATSPVSVTERATPRPSRWYRHPAFVSLASAAVVLVAVRGVDLLAPAPEPPAAVVAEAPPWGWQKEDESEANLTSREYLHRLAERAEEWFNKRPESPSDLARRIGQFRQGCSKIMLSSHEPLPVADRVWLHERCGLWAKKLDQHLIDVEQGRDVATVRKEADETIRTLITALKNRSAGAT